MMKLLLPSSRSFLGMAFILLLSSAEAIHVRSKIEATKRVHEHEEVVHQKAKTVQSWTNSELMQLKGQVKSLSLHFQFLNDAVTDRNEVDIKSGVKKLTTEVHNCKDIFSKIIEFNSNAEPCPENEYDADCVSSDVLDELSDSISLLFGDPFLDKITDNLGVYTLSKDKEVQKSLEQIKKTIHGSSESDQKKNGENGKNEDQEEMRRLTGCLSALDKELVEETPSPEILDEALTKAPHATATTLTSNELETRFLESGVVHQVAKHGQHIMSGQLRRTEDTPGSLLVQGIMSMIIGVPLIAFGILLSMALVLVFGVIYAVASFLGLNFITKNLDKHLVHTVNHGLNKLNQAISWIVPKEGIKIGEIRRESVFAKKYRL